ncbi:MAG: prepilin-type N-terminal cleavage/methylation domain-containing protein [Magnetococcales bacterium]|nr:prepilin-type N-terminal cleavage/methylation domain-containing protein [Magnetococcales bacterium]
MTFLNRLSRRSEQGFTLAELMIVIAIIAVLAATQTPKLLAAYKNAQSSEAVQVSAIITQKVNDYVSSHSGIPYATISASLKPGSGKQGNLGSGVAADEITSLIPTLTVPENSRYTYEVDADVQANYSVRVCVKAYKPSDPTAFILYSSKESQKVQWEGNVFKGTFLDNTVIPVAGGYCTTSGAVGPDAG